MPVDVKTCYDILISQINKIKECFIDLRNGGLLKGKMRK